MPSEKDLILIFSIDGCKFSIGIEDLIEVTENLELSSNYHSEECLGKVEFRGSEIPLVDIKKRLSLPEEGQRICETAAIVKVWDAVIALPIDSVEGVFVAGSGVFPFPRIMLMEEDAYTFIYRWNEEFVLFMNLPGIYNKDAINKISNDGQSTL